MSSLMSYEPAVLAVHTAVVALSTLGIVEWLKNFIHPKKKRTYAVVGLIVLLICVQMQLPYVNPTLTWGWNLFTLGLAFIQFGHAALIKLPETMINKTIGDKDERNKSK